jgi:hypothetical protein
LTGVPSMKVLLMVQRATVARHKGSGDTMLLLYLGMRRK